jgi:hypothetical protein
VEERQEEGRALRGRRSRGRARVNDAGDGIDGWQWHFVEQVLRRGGVWAHGGTGGRCTWTHRGQGLKKLFSTGFYPKSGKLIVFYMKFNFLENRTSFSVY